MDSPKAILTKEGEISIITLNDGKANVFSPAMIRMLIAVWIMFLPILVV